MLTYWLFRFLLNQLQQIYLHTVYKYPIKPFCVIFHWSRDHTLKENWLSLEELKGFAFVPAPHLHSGIFLWLEIVMVLFMLSKPLWAHMCSCSAMSRVSAFNTLSTLSTAIISVPLKSVIKMSQLVLSTPQSHILYTSTNYRSLYWLLSAGRKLLIYIMQNY